MVFLQLVLLGYQVRRGEDGRLLRVWAVGTIIPFQNLLSRGGGFVSSAWKDYVWLTDTRAENKRLRAENDRLRLEQQQLRRALARFSREEELIVYQEQISSQTVLAQVIGASANPNAKEFFLDKGTRAGVRAGMAVITPDGVVGKIQASYARASLLLLINDPDSGVGVVLRDSQRHGVLKGSGGYECQLENVEPEIEVKPGEPIYTSGDDRIYPRGLPVGEVTRVGPGAEYQEIYVRPFAPLDRLREVLVVTFGVHQDLPRHPRPQPPEMLMPVPPASIPKTTAAAIDGGRKEGAREPVRSGESAGPQQGLPAEPVTPLTDADKLRDRYQAIGDAQQHRFGEGEPGSPAPDFNLGVTTRMPARSQPPARDSTDGRAPAGPSRIQRRVEADIQDSSPTAAP